MRSAHRGLLILALACGLQSCVLQPDPTAAEIQAQSLPNLQVPQAWTAEATGTGNLESGWLEQFDDPYLQGLVAEALVYNADLSQAAARVEQAAAYGQIARGRLYPAVSILGRGGIEDSSEDSGLQGAIASASWELDVWGRVRYGARSAADQHAAAQADYVFARQSLAGLVVQSWVLAIEASLQRDLAREMTDAAGALFDLAETRERVGIGSELDVTISRVNLNTYRDMLLQLDLSREQALRALEVLLGRYPSAEITVAQRLPDLTAAAPAGLPSELLERRPDVIAATRRVGAAFSRVQEARAARLPSLFLTGSVSDLTSELFVLQDRDQPQWGLGGKVLAPLFTGGALRAQVSVRTAEQKQAIAAYAATAARAFADVENALAGEASMRSRESGLAVTVVAARRALQLSEERYRVGAGDLRSVEQQQLSWHSARVNLLRVQSEQRAQRVSLHMALGGDYSPGP
jgi:multidrug efflux system outer membrane protein